MNKHPRIACHIGPVGEAGPLISRYDREIGALHAGVSIPRPCSNALNIDGLMLLDIHEDGGLDGIEILYPLHKSLLSGNDSSYALAKYRRAFVRYDHNDLGEIEDRLNVSRDGDLYYFMLDEGGVETVALLGPSVSALIGQNELRGILLDTSRFKISR